MTNAQGNRGWATVMVAAIVVMLAAAIVSRAQNSVSFTTLFTFDKTDGANPAAWLIQANDGSLYGTTQYGGTSRSCANGCGTVFKTTLDGVLTTLHSFDCSTEGCEPASALVQGTDGNFYGTTASGESNLASGTVFRITPDGTLTTLHTFGPKEGFGSLAALVEDSNGYFYGTTPSGGGVAATCRGGCGTVFRITSDGTLTTLHGFDATDGSFPRGALVVGVDGNLYGITSEGGSMSCGVGCGTVFKMTPNGTLTTLHRFHETDGITPAPELVQAADGNFYGTTGSGGVYNAGTFFRITPSGEFTTLYNFVCEPNDCPDGEESVAGLVQATDGNFYGTNILGGAYGSGTAFSITASGMLTTLHNFCDREPCRDRADQSLAAVVQATDGNLYGSIYQGGNEICFLEGCGTLFRLSVGLGPFVETEPSSDKVGAAVGVLGTNLAGATSVAFNDITASFKVISGSLISTTVPAGATTGPVQVTLPSGTLTSNVNFKVLP
jgi:uncharacterized repeat protein (TIGR03803 family)